MKSRPTLRFRLSYYPSAALRVLIAAITFCASARAQELNGSDERLGKQILALIDKAGASQAHWGIEVISVNKGDELVGWNENRLFVPASTTKLFVAAAALSRLGPDFRYRTTVEAAAPIGPDGTLPSDLILVGRGDPNLSGRVLPYQHRTDRADSPTKHFEELAADLAAQGLRVVEGNLIVDDSYFVSAPFPQGWEVDDLMWNYGAPVSALTINDNVLFITITPGPAPDTPAAIKLEPDLSYYQIDNRLNTVPRVQQVPGGGSSRAERSLSIDRQPGTTLLRLWGQIPEGDAGWGRGLSIGDPPRFAGEFFREELARRGIAIKGTVQVRRLERPDVLEPKGGPGSIVPSLPAPYTLVGHESLPLTESLRVILKVSQNLHSEMLLRTLGHERRGVGSAEAGLEDIREFLESGNQRREENDDDAPATAVLLRDASGLSRQNLATPKAMADFLRRMEQSDYGALWRAMLPIAGEDGTLAERLKGAATRKRVWAKTGSLTGVAALAGYALNQDNELLAFVLFANQYDPATTNATAILDRIAELIARSK
jgi:D-alanyl-D-alanine carboxypeptidase/D-alanyl-D-alanine-endopeptidase (penicillin-binding protein 4)